MSRMALVTTLTLAAALMGCPEPDPCADWIGTWRGTFAGTVEGRPFNLSGAQFQLQVVSSGSAPAVTIKQTWQLGGGYSAEISGVGFDCADRQIELAGIICFLRLDSAATDNCVFSGALFREGESSGSLRAPDPRDGSPTYEANGNWTLSH